MDNSKLLHILVVVFVAELPDHWKFKFRLILYNKLNAGCEQDMIQRALQTTASPRRSGFHDPCPVTWDIWSFKTFYLVILSWQSITCKDVSKLQQPKYAWELYKACQTCFVVFWIYVTFSPREARQYIAAENYEIQVTYYSNYRYK